MANYKAHPEEIRLDFNAGLPYAVIAKKYGMTVGGVQQAAEREGFQGGNVSHKSFLPWIIATEHQHSREATNLRNLSRYVQFADVPEVKLNTALRWLLSQVERGLDIDYDRDCGFTTKPLAPGGHLSAVHENVRVRRESETTENAADSAST
ncbi:hypothetical protein [Nonomuraea typhae]|uniref:hypothetical protein n=1 Tax=Nonomuraea typhae TaxID=2603600 RepID=UPI0012FB1F12|nr:hypothetical protein [Nonomuraea typhae]